MVSSYESTQIFIISFDTLLAMLTTTSPYVVCCLVTGSNVATMSPTIILLIGTYVPYFLRTGVKGCR